MLGEQHVVSVALGPPEDVVDAWGVSCHQSCSSCQSYCCIHICVNTLDCGMHTVCTHQLFPADLKVRPLLCVVRPLFCVVDYRLFCMFPSSLSVESCFFSNHMVAGSYAYVQFQSGRTFQLLKSVNNFLDWLMQLERTPEVCCILQVFKGTFQKPNLSLAEMQVQSATGCVAYLTLCKMFLIGTQSPDS